MYYPLSQIVTNLYTNGEEYALQSTLQPYTGYYWRTSQNKFFTGKNPQDTPIEALIPLINPLQTQETSQNLVFTEISYSSEDVSIYDSISETPFTSVQIPTYSPNVPTQQDYENGEYTRYFCKKTNEIIYIEIDKDTYDKLISQDATIDFQYYLSFSIPWQLTGDKEQVFTVNRNIVALTMKQLKLPKFDLYLKGDYTKYYI